MATDLEKKPWYRNTMALLALAGSVIGIVVAVTQIPFGGGETERVQENIEIVVDRSLGMQELFDGGTKWAAAVLEVEEVLQGVTGAGSNLALRWFGGPCSGGENSKLAVDFSQQNEDPVRDRLQKLAPDGDAALVSGVVEAVSDFADPERFRDVMKRIIVITGSGDKCLRDPVGDLRRKLVDWDGEAEFRFIGMGVDPEQASALNQMAELTGGRAFFARNRQELKEALHYVLEVEPVQSDVRVLVGVLNDVRDSLNAALRHLDDGEFGAAEDQLAKADRALTRTELPFRDLSSRRSREQFRQLYELGLTCRKLQVRGLELASQLVAYGRADQIANYNRTIEEMNRLIAEYGRNINSMNRILSSL